MQNSFNEYGGDDITVAEMNRANAYAAYKVLVDIYKVKKPTKDDMAIAINEAIGYLSEISAE